ncbi:MAG: hypothetical protein KBS53_05385 [Bacteroidales bacterium]|nr:hypothetical protein [Candidatus Hennigimonas equi]
MERKKLTRANVALCLAALLLAGCRAPFVPSDKDVFLNQTDVCMVAGRKEYIGGSTGRTQSSYNPTRHLFRGGNIDVVKDTVLNVTVETVNSYFVLMADAVPGSVGTEVSGVLYLKHPSLPNSYRTYGTGANPASFEVIKEEKNMVWLWENKLKIGIVIRLSATVQGQ